MISTGRMAPALLALWIPAAASPAVTSVDALRRDVAWLAAPERDGRLAGTAGAKQAADYIAQQLRQLGASPLPGAEGFRQAFEFTAGMNDDGSSLQLEPQGGDEPRRWHGVEQVQALSFSDTAVVSGPVVFAGYGMTVPDGQDFGYDSYVGLDVEDKIVLVLRYFPEDTEDELRATLARYSGLRYKALQARERGAKGLLIVAGPRSPNAGETVGMSFDTALSGSGIAAASIGGDVAAAIFAHVEGKSLDQVQESLDTGNPHVGGFEIPGVRVTLDARIERESKEAFNLLAYLSAKGQPDERSVILGAHYDHLGHGGHGNSLAKKSEVGQVHHGADDNASGVAAVLEAARRLAAAPQRPPVVLAFWAGEELGLLGSSHFVKSESMPKDRIAAYVNFDMVGRVRDNKLTLQSVGSSSAWPRLIEQTNVVVGFDVRTQDDPYLPTDSSSFYLGGVPTLNFFSGSHEDYHRPSDTPARVNYEDLDRVARFAALLTRRLGGLETPPDYLTVARKSESGVGRDTVRAWTGTIPDYTTEVPGLRLSGVIEGGPADKAGLREGDVIVVFAGREITNIYDYTFALDVVKIGQDVEVVVERDGQRLEVTITPASRR